MRPQAAEHDVIIQAWRWWRRSEGAHGRWGRWRRGARCAPGAIGTTGSAKRSSCSAGCGLAVGVALRRVEGLVEVERALARMKAPGEPRGDTRLVRTRLVGTSVAVKGGAQIGVIGRGVRLIQRLHVTAVTAVTVVTAPQ